MTTTRDTYRSGAALEVERNGYNLAFGELGLEWYWDAKSYAELQTIPEDGLKKGERVRSYLQTHQPHLLRAYDVEFLVNAIEIVRTQCAKSVAN